VKNRILIRKVRAALVLAIGLSSAAASANQYKEATLGQKVANSDEVIIGQVTSTSQTDCLPSFSCATVNIVKQLKGSGASKVVVLFDGPIAEQNPICCKVGATYVFFLKHVKAIYYESANGPYGIYQAHQ
jgi:hypothetical protein